MDLKEDDLSIEIKGVNELQPRRTAPTLRISLHLRSKRELSTLHSIVQVQKLIVEGSFLPLRISYQLVSFFREAAAKNYSQQHWSRRSLL